MNRILTCLFLFIFGMACALVSCRSSGVPGGTGEPKTILFVGDSLTQGLGVAPSERYTALIRKKIEDRGWNFKVVNEGVSGDTTEDGLNRLDAVLDRPVDVLVLALGANDGLRKVEATVTKKNLQAILNRTRSRHPEAKQVLVGIKLGIVLGMFFSKEFKTMFKETAKKNGIAFIPNLLDGVAGKPQLNIADGLHPNAKGHKIIAETVWDGLEPVLKTL